MRQAAFTGPCMSQDWGKILPKRSSTGLVQGAEQREEGGRHGHPACDPPWLPSPPPAESRPRGHGSELCESGEGALCGLGNTPVWDHGQSLGAHLWTSPPQEWPHVDARKWTRASHASFLFLRCAFATSKPCALSHHCHRYYSYTWSPTRAGLDSPCKSWRGLGKCPWRAVASPWSLPPLPGTSLHSLARAL